MFPNNSRYIYILFCLALVSIFLCMLNVKMQSMSLHYLSYWEFAGEGVQQEERKRDYFFK